MSRTSRAPFVGLFLFAMTIQTFSSRAQPADTSDTTPPNILLIVADDQHFGDYGFMGHPHIQTPHIDRLARESMVWPLGRVTTSLCCPSLATLITGQYPRRHGITGNTPSRSHPRFTEANDTYIKRMQAAPRLPTLLAERGYLCLQTGKWWQGSFRTGGFTDGMTHGDTSRGGRHGDAGLRIGRDGLDPIDQFIAQASDEDRPFFIWYAPFLPHTPHTPPQRLLRQYESIAPSASVAKYWAMCTWLDETVGSLRALLDSHGIAENTAIVFVCDNGWINRLDRSAYAPRSKRSPFDGGLRTPIMLHWPGHVERGRSDGLACSIDIAPTILSLAGAPAPESMDGVDLRDQRALASRSVLYGVVYSHDAVDYADPSKNWEYKWCVTEGWKLMVPNAARFPNLDTLLYHVAEDALESTDLAQSEPERVTAMTGMIERWWDTR